MVGGGFIHATAPTGRSAGLLQLGSLGGEAHLGEAQEDQAEDWAGVFLSLEAGIGAELVGGAEQKGMWRVVESTSIMTAITQSPRKKL